MKKNLIVTGLILVVFLLGELFVWNKFVKTKEVDYDLDKAKVLVDNYYTDNYLLNGNLFTDGMSDRYMIGKAFDKSIDKAKDYNCNEIYKDSERDDQGIVVGEGTFCDGIVKGISYKDLESSYKELFGKNAKLDKKTVGIFGYVKDEDIFVSLSCRCGGEGFTKYVYGVKDATLKGDKLTVHVYYASFEPEEGKEEEEIDTNKYISENKDKMAVYTMNFVKENKTYKLLSVKK